MKKIPFDPRTRACLGAWGPYRIGTQECEELDSVYTFAPARFVLGPDHRNHAAHAGIPGRKQVQILHLSGYTAGYRAVVESQRNQENLIKRYLGGATESVAQLAVKRSAFGSGAARKARHEEVRGLDRGFDGSRPVLSRKQLPLIQPGAQAVLLESLVQFLGLGQIFLHVCDEHPRLGLTYETNPVLTARHEFAQPVDLDCGALLQSFAQQTRNTPS